MKIKYRNMTLEDHEELVKLWGESGNIGLSESDDPEHFKAYIEKNGDCCFVACDGDKGDKIVGTVLAGDDARRAFINHLYVASGYRCMKIGTELGNMAERALAEKAPSKAYVFVKNNNTEGINFWKKRNFYVCEDFLTMRKSLDGSNFQVYRELDNDSVKEYLEDRKLTGEGSEVSVTEFGDGNMNHIFLVTENGERRILKQAMPHGKIDVTVFEPMDRAVYESRYISYFSKFMPEKLEKNLYSDAIMCLNMYEDLSGMSVMRGSLLAGTVYARTGKDIGEYLAAQYYYSSCLYLDIEEKKKMETTFANLRMRQLTEDFILMNPFEDSENNNIDEAVMPLVEKIRSNRKVCSRAKELAMKFVSDKECIISGDFHPGNVFVSEEKTVFFDFDFACWGPIAYDLGTMLGNLILSYETRQAYNPEKESLGEEIKAAIKDMFAAFGVSLKGFLKDWDEDVVDGMLAAIEKDAVGYAGATVAGRSYGYARFKEATMLEGREDRLYFFEKLTDDVIYLISGCTGVEELLQRL